MAYSVVASQADTPTAGPDSTYFTQLSANDDALILATGAKISSVTAGTVATGVTQKLTLGTVVFDSLGGSYTGTADRITIPASYGGVYLVQGSLNVTASSSAGQTLQVKVRKNNTTDVWEVFDTGGTNVGVSLCCPFTVALSATDYLEIYTVNGTANTATYAETLGMSLTVIWLHA